LIGKMSLDKLPKSIKLDLIEAIEATKDADLVAKTSILKASGTETDTFKEALYGGTHTAGRDYFLYNSTGQCSRCHTIGNETNTVGPNLRKIGSKLTREQILQAMIEPSARLAPGYGTVTLKLVEGEEVTGILMHETEQFLELKTNEAEPLKIPLVRIKSRENMPSAMPAMGTLMSKREIRDVVEFLSNMK
jgi:quinoprotein glucose dehydrogenase